ncbi:hypothetical protein FACS189487_00350 [Campylobacterota bacterium]|nr:hypothetical protein FACS189487_00350 [Campylobacterota bacterium]
MKYSKEQLRKLSGGSNALPDSWWESQMDSLLAVQEQSKQPYSYLEALDQELRNYEISKNSKKIEEYKRMIKQEQMKESLKEDRG